MKAFKLKNLVTFAVLLLSLNSQAQTDFRTIKAIYIKNVDLVPFAIYDDNSVTGGKRYIYKGFDVFQNRTLCVKDGEVYSVLLCDKSASSATDMKDAFYSLLEVYEARSSSYVRMYKTDSDIQFSPPYNEEYFNKHEDEIGAQIKKGNIYFIAVFRSEELGKKVVITTDKDYQLMVMIDYFNSPHLRNQKN